MIKLPECFVTAKN